MFSLGGLFVGSVIITASCAAYTFLGMESKEDPSNADGIILIIGIISFIVMIITVSLM